jgi:hypothetical protein
MGFRARCSHRVGRAAALVAIATLASSVAVFDSTAPAGAASLPSGFQEEIVF